MPRTWVLRPWTSGTLGDKNEEKKTGGDKKKSKGITRRSSRWTQ